MDVVLLTLTAVLAATFVIAAAGKLLRLEEFRAALRLSHLPEPLVARLTLGTPFIELVVAISLVLAPGDWLTIPILVAAVLLVVFTGWMLFVLKRRLRVRCSCFGAAGGEIGPGTIVRNAGLVLVSVLAFALSIVIEAPVPDPSLLAVVTATSALLSLMVGVAVYTAYPHLALTLEGVLRDQTPDMEEVFLNR